jgi:ribonuclease E
MEIPATPENVESTADDASAADGPPRKPRRRGSRGGRGRNRAANTNAAVDRQPEDLPDRPSEGRPSGPAAAKATVMPGEAGIFPPGLKPKIGDSRPARELQPESESLTGGADAVAGGNGGGDPGTAKRRRRRGGRGRSRSGAGSSPIEAAIGGPIELDPEMSERRRGRERKGRPVGRYLMGVHVRPGATQIAVLEGRSLIQHVVSRPQDDANQIDGNIYLGRVQNVLPGMEAAFVDIGTPKNAVLYRGDVQFDPDDVEERGEARIEHLLRPGQTIVCQVTKNPIGTKGARLTQEVSLAGRFVVLVPNSSTYGISKRLGDDERKRLRRILDEVKPAEHGIIVRTAADGAVADELRRDVQRLVKQWEQIEALAKRSKAPALLYREPTMAVRVIREEFNRDYRGVVIDDRELYEEIRSYVESVNPELADRVEFFDTEVEPLPLLERFHIHEQLHKALDRKVWLPSGGSIIIERTEALTVIDVNTGKNVGSSSLEETVFKNNLEAAEEVARQLRLRDIGGIIVIDFIDMEISQNRAEVIRAFRGALARDKTKTQVFDISELGLVEMTRKRVSEGLVESFSDICPTCNGRGIVLDQDLL